jgi:hypothetical protein
VLGAGCWVLGAGCWVLGAGCWVLGAGCWVLGAEQVQRSRPRERVGRVGLPRLGFSCYYILYVSVVVVVVVPPI